LRSSTAFERRSTTIRLSALALDAAVLAVALAATARPARAQGFFEQSPGPLSASHAALEGQGGCANCHVSGRELANAKCLGCHAHEDMKARIAAGRGLHASERVAGKPCWSCHTEHKGRGHDLLGFGKLAGGRDRFDHRLTGWPLEGAHAAKPRCEACHTKKSALGLRLYTDAQPACASCHKKDSPHGPARGDADRCSRCHSQAAWRPPLARPEFDHNDPRQARYALVGAHAGVACARCHATTQKGPVWRIDKDFTDCRGCHGQNEPRSHKEHLFDLKRCELCHSEKRAWKAFVFDHRRRTGFTLEGKHAQLGCYTCHAPRVSLKPSRACETCHAREDHHKGRFAKFPMCATCHDQLRWKPVTAFNHDARTHFRLTGKHADATCRACHRGRDPSQFERFAAGIQCMQCHRHETAHAGKFTNDQCLGCHKMAGSRGAKASAQGRFHGPDSSFPLDGGHVGVACIRCHPKPNPSADNVWEVSSQCGPLCHPDRLHKGSLGNDCERCHEGGFWKASRFDHDRDAKFALVGFHRQAGCARCHPSRVYKPVDSRCVACHGKDDAHAGALGLACEKCHEPSSRSLFVHNTMSRFRLEGKHQTVACKLCHPDLRFKPVATDCASCHQDDDVHKGAFGPLCERCHTPKGWRTTKPLHDVGAFRLAGAHDHVPCARCHGEMLRPLAGTGDLCITCHRQDDIHHNSLGPRCGECHSQWAFAPSTFLHQSVGCDLRSIHRTLPCESCHRGGNYMALAPTCVACHRRDALYATAKDPAHRTYATCANCHNANFWTPNVGGYAQQVESVCR
jgi:hypothetical protein